MQTEGTTDESQASILNNPFRRLPREIILVILKKLPIQSLATMQLVNQSFKTLIESEGSLIQQIRQQQLTSQYSSILTSPRLLDACNKQLPGNNQIDGNGLIATMVQMPKDELKGLLQS